jgi:hypothetical protein
MTHEVAFLNCSFPGCVCGISPDPRHIPNLTAGGGWLCHHHDDEEDQRMNREQLDLIPDSLLIHRRTKGLTQLIEWLGARGWHMTLAEVESERRRRGITAPERTAA